MGSRKCIVPNCDSSSASPGVTFHKFPVKKDIRVKWVAAVYENTQFHWTHLVCMKHFKKSDFVNMKKKKAVLKKNAVPSIFPSGLKQKSDTKESKSSGSSQEESEQKPPEDDIDKQVEEKIEAIKAEIAANETQSQTVVAPIQVKPNPKKKRTALPPKSKRKTAQKKKIKRIKRPSASDAAKTAQNNPAGESSKVLVPVPYLKLGSKLEAQDFDGKWHDAKVVEVDSDESEVLIHFEKSEKLSDEWIPMDSVRLRPIQSHRKQEKFEVGEKCMARWNDSRKFPATVQKILENDLYEVLFNDGYLKTVRNTCMMKLKQPQGHVLGKPTSLSPDNLHLNVDNIPIPTIPHDGEWCCYWINDNPVGKAGHLEFSHGVLNTIIVDDWRLPSGWTKHLYQRTGNYSGKWDTILVSPDKQKFKSKQELKQYLQDTNTVYDPLVFDFCLHKKRAKSIGLLTYTDDFKTPTSANVSLYSESPQNISNVSENTGPVKEAYLGALKVEVKNNLFLCPDCNKSFRKENHLQIHIKHYHKESASLLGVCPNMQDLAYFRTADYSEANSYVDPSTLKLGKNEVACISSDTHISVTTDHEINLPSEEKCHVREAVAKGSGNSAVKQETSIDKVRKRPSKTDDAVVQKKVKIEECATDSAYVEPVFSYGAKDLYVPQPVVKHRQNGNYIRENGEIIKIVRMKKEEIINCICSYTEADGLMIQCELCLCWQHSMCNGITKESEVPEKYICFICRNPERVRSSLRFIHDQDWLYDGKLPCVNTDQKPSKKCTFLQESHRLLGNILEIKKLLHSLRVKASIANNKDHPKMYLWSSKWEGNSKEKAQRSSDELLKTEQESILAGLLAPKQMADGMSQEQDDEKYVPREEAIDPLKCQKTLLNHLQKQQMQTFLRLQEIEEETNELDSQIPVEQLPVSGSYNDTINVMLHNIEKLKALADICV